MVAFYVDKAKVQKYEKRCKTGMPISTTNKQGRIKEERKNLLPHSSVG